MVTQEQDPASVMEALGAEMSNQLLSPDEVSSDGKLSAILPKPGEMADGSGASLVRVVLENSSVDVMDWGTPEEIAPQTTYAYLQDMIQEHAAPP